MGFIYSIQICEISHQTFGPSHRKCPTCPVICMNTGNLTGVHQTTRKLLGFYRTNDRFWPDFANIKHDYTQEFYRSYSSFISQCPRTGKFRSVWYTLGASKIHIYTVILCVTTACTVKYILFIWSLIYLFFLGDVTAKTAWTGDFCLLPQKPASSRPSLPRGVSLGIHLLNLNTLKSRRLEKGKKQQKRKRR